MYLAHIGSDPHALVNTLADMLADFEALTLNDTQRDAHALVDNLADTLAEVEAMKLGDTWVNSHELVDSFSNTLAEVEAVPLGDTPGERTHWSKLWLIRYQRLQRRH